MAHRISPLWWPVLAITSPLLIPGLLVRNTRFKKDILSVRELNRQRFENAGPVDLPELEFLKITVLSEYETDPGFKGAPGISYIIETDLGSVLFDLAFGPEDPGLGQNAEKTGFKLNQVDAVVISHLHPDHMGGIQAARKNRLMFPETFGNPGGIPCFLPGPATAEGFETHVVTAPRLLPAGLATTGPLSRSLFLLGRTDEQAVVARLKGKGIVVITGCGHPTIKNILRMVAEMTCEPVFAVCGGLHLPITDSPFKKPGIKVQMIWGTGKPPWKKITCQDLDQTISVLNQADIKTMLLSRHDCCQYAAEKLNTGLKADVSILKAGAQYSFLS